MKKKEPSKVQFETNESIVPSQPSQAKYLRFKPSKEDLKEVFEAMIQESKQETTMITTQAN